MKCEICGKEIKEEESYKGCCKECAVKIFDKIEKNNTRKKAVLEEIDKENIKSYSSEQFQKNDTEFDYIDSNPVASSISTINDIIFIIMIILAILIFVGGIVISAEAEELYISAFVFAIIEVIAAFIVHLFVKGFAEIIKLLDQINKKIRK